MHTEMGVCAVLIKSFGERQVNLGEVRLKINRSPNFSANVRLYLGLKSQKINITV